MDFTCILCDYYTSNKKDYSKHLQTQKHKRNNMETPGNIKSLNKCLNCEKIYKDRSGLWKHKKKCNTQNKHLEKDMDTNEKSSEEFNSTDKDIIMLLLKDNAEFKNKQISEQNKQIMELSSKNNNNITNNSINSYNKTFNLQVFLNEKCKDALNINDFVNSLNLSLVDLENFGENGFVDGISKIFVKGLKNLDIYKRPIHCSDLKRETMHVKEQTGWEKDNENKDRLKKVVKMIAHKNMLKIGDWKQANPQHKNSDSKKNDQYLKMLIGTAGPTNKDDEIRYYEKIIKNIAKEVTIDKVI